MKKLLKLAAVGASAALLVSSLSFAQIPTPVTTTQRPVSTTTVQPVSAAPAVPGGGGTTVTVVKGGTTPPPGFKVCYRASQRHIEGSRIVQRCGPYGCRDFRISRDFYVTVYKDCHMSKFCAHGYQTYGWYPTKMEARDATERCERTIKGMVPEGWRLSF